MQLSRLITRSSMVVATLALLSCGESNPVGPGGNIVERIEFTPASTAIGSGRSTTVELQNTGNVAVGPISLDASPVRNSGGVEQPSASMTASPASIATMNPNDTETLQLSVNATNLSDGTYTSTLSARRGSDELATVQLSFSVSSGGGGGPVASIVITAGPVSAEQGAVGAYVAEARDSAGSPLNGVQVNWAVEPSSAGLMTAEGKFVGYGIGQPQVIASAGGAADTIQVTVTSRSTPSGSFAVTGQGVVADRFTSDLWAHGNVVLTGTWSTRNGNPGNVLNVWDISSPDSPVLTDSVVVDARTVNDVKFSPDGSLAVLSHERGNTNGVTFLDMSSPLTPVVITQFSDLLEPSTNNSVHNVWLDQGYAYVANSITNLMRVVDISNPQAPTTVSSQNFGAGPSPALHDVYVRDGLAFLSNWTDGLIIVDVGNGVAGGSPNNPREVSRIGFGGFSAHNAWYWPAAGYVFVGDEVSNSSLGVGIVKVVDISDPATPREVASFQQGGDSPHNFWLDEARGILYAAWYGNGVYAMDVSGELLGRLDLQGREITNSRYNGSTGCDFSSPATVSRTCTWAPQLHNGRLYVSDLDAGLIVLQPNF